MNNTVLLKLIFSTVKTDGGIGSEICVKANMSETMTVAQGSSPSDCGHEISQRRSLLFSVLTMVKNEVIGGVADVD